jgi:Protein of unknown function (DUF3572)
MRRLLTLPDGVNGSGMKPPVKRTRQAPRDSGGRENAETLAIAALSFLAEDPDRLGTFLALSGIGPESLRAAAGEPHFLAGVLEHVVSNEKLLLDFATHQNIDPFDVARARLTLAGSEDHP